MIRLGASGLFYYCAPLVCVSEVIELLAVWRHNKPKTKKVSAGHDMCGTLWTHAIQPAAWQMSLMQPIYKGGNKSRADPASYRGIYLSSALAKLFEGILISRLIKFTENHNTLTETNLGPNLVGRSMMRFTACSLSFNTT